MNFRVQNAASNNQPILIGITVFSLCSWGAFYDLIVVDEAGQYSLSNTIAVSMHAKYGVFLGDQNQLPNVSQANHPHPVDKSVMEYCVGDYKVIPDEVGIFISKSWRLHPKICEIVSKIYYENQLTYSKEMAKRKILSDGSSEAKVTVKVFSSLTCPHCADFHNSIFDSLYECEASYYTTSQARLSNSVAVQIKQQWKIFTSKYPNTLPAR